MIVVLRLVRAEMDATGDSSNGHNLTSPHDQPTIVSPSYLIANAAPYSNSTLRTSPPVHLIPPFTSFTIPYFTLTRISTHAHIHTHPLRPH
ncbi:hypothetical protein VTJ04DRAFT_1409 [Mycothermus thermophilus]|uniref:uncharacterized protein n=1 Tax=Humicola insolens TaxID=85995 RepID=UPI003743173E